MTYENTDEWYGSFPSDIQQWFVMEGKLPKIFDTKQQALQYIVDECLIRNYNVLQIAGKVETLKLPQRTVIKRKDLRLPW